MAKQTKPKDPGAAALGAKRWRGVSKQERTRLARRAARIRWAKTKGGPR
jgi:hypothetical protein